MFTGVEAARAEWVATDCPLAAIQIDQGSGRAAAHPVRILADAYGLSIDDSAPTSGETPAADPPPARGH